MSVACACLFGGVPKGVLGRKLPGGVEYVGIDASQFLIRKAQSYDRAAHHRYAVADITRPYSTILPSGTRSFTHAAMVLSLQNVRDQSAALRLASEHLVEQGRLVVVLNHPCFRVPRQSRWDVDPQNNVQYRRVDRYHSPLEVPIAVHPGKDGAEQNENSAVTYSYHHPMEDYFRWLHEAGMAVELMEEWYSDKTSEGKQSKRENRARTEFPLFLAISAFKHRSKRSVPRDNKAQSDT